MRQLLIGAETPVAVSYSNGLLANGAIDVQKRDVNGEITSLLPGDTVADAPEIRFAQGTASENIVSPWIPGKNIVSWNGREYLAQTAKNIRTTFATTSTTAGNVVLKFVRTDVQPQEFFNITAYVDAGTGLAVADIVNQLEAQCATMKSDGNSNSGAGTIDIIGSIDGDTTNSGAIWDGGAVQFESSCDISELTGTTVSDAVQAALVPGVGNGYQLKSFEESLRGSNFGYYNRIHLPNTPDTYTALSGTYDMYSIVATKDGSTSPQIKGVDNLMEIYVAIEVDTAAITQAFEGQLNPYCNDRGFAPVNL